ncbi:laminin G Domain protein [Luteitalea sp. TBR-22]|uniref:LamG domain-containing protein n=1 Tax=Luteitalea sp. TBR-22 TaxID=2802971 RepID=UPI001AF333CD|nr:LamG domain-containing protein [Luteitalea sp. TBR-22]BCS32488.1 laminin G Domain protein [Luteitalea sp. TBR-22]
MHACPAVLAILVVALVAMRPMTAPAQVTAPPSETWRFDRVDRIGGRDVTRLGDPRVVDSPLGRVVEFDGVDDALLVAGHPLEGAQAFTWEAVFRPDGGAREQRWFHLQEDGSDNRRLFEIRVAGEQWFLDAFAFSNGNEKALINREALHPVGRWYHVAAVYDGTTFSSYVDGVKQLDFPLEIAPLKAGRTSVGVRITLVNYFKGAIHSARFTRRALAPSEFEGTQR